MTEVNVGAVVGGLIGGPDEKRFRHRLEQEVKAIDDIWTGDESDNDQDIQLDAKDIAQLKLLEQELARRKTDGATAAATASAHSGSPRSPASPYRDHPDMSSPQEGKEGTSVASP